MSVARRLAEFLAETRTADLPAQTMEHAAMLIASTLASAAAGRDIESARIIRALATERGGRAEASVWFEPHTKLPAADAAQANAVMSDAAASDDSDLRAIVHCGTPLTAASLAIAERESKTGEEVLAAIVLGYEAAGRIGEAVTPGFRNRGFHGCLIAVFAASVAAARLLGLGPSRMTQAIALSATSVGGLMAAANTSTAREYHAGLATRLGIDAALAAQRNFRGKSRILECRHGFFESYGGIDAAIAGTETTRDLGASWDIVTDMAVKLVPGGHPYHAFAEAAANAAREGDIEAQEVESITVSRPGMTALTGPLHPTDLIDMAHSPAYFTAAGVADRSFGWGHATPEKIKDPVIHTLIDKIRVGPPPGGPAERYRQGATVTIRTADGREVADTVFVPKGAGMLGIDWADIDAKYRTLMPLAGLSDTQIEQSLALIRGLRRLAPVSKLTGLMQPQR
ncbi:MAG TPA: MmgE/PrpD family protein [Stellaceae bacterium]